MPPELRDKHKTRRQLHPHEIRQNYDTQTWSMRIELSYEFSEFLGFAQTTCRYQAIYIQIFLTGRNTGFMHQ